MNQSLPRIEGDFTGNPLATRSAGPVVNPSAWAKWQFCGVPIPSGPGAMPDKPGSGNPVLHRRTLLRIGLMALTCALFLGRASTAGSLAERQVTPPLDVPARATTPVGVVSNPFLGLVRLESRCSLRLGKCRHVIFMTVGWDDPNDDETSDDPADDDDAWEGLNALGETEVPVPAWFQQDRLLPQRPRNSIRTSLVGTLPLHIVPDGATAPLLAFPGRVPPRGRADILNVAVPHMAGFFAV